MQSARFLAPVLIAFAAIDVALAAVCAIELGRARSDAALVDRRAGELAAGDVIRKVDDMMVRLLAESSARGNDRAIQGLLAANDVTFRVNPPPPPGGAAKAAPEPPR